MSLLLDPIGVVRTPFAEKFGVPRQASLAAIRAVIELDDARIPASATRGLAGASHVWVISWFDRVAPSLRATVRPPRLGGNTRLGVFATRSPYRPNPIGISAVRLVAVDGLRLTIEGCDLVDRTPVLDIKPYVAWADSIGNADVAWAQAPPVASPVHFELAAEAALGRLRDAVQLRADIEATLTHDPRPSYHHDATRTYAATLFGVNVRFVRQAGAIVVVDIEACTDS